MRALIQRVSEAAVRVDGAVIGQTGPGLLILVCAMQGDDEARAKALAEKISKIRIFADSDGKTNLSLLQTHASALVVSQFTLAADTSRGNRLGFSNAASPDVGRTLYEVFAAHLSSLGVTVECGQFGADMQVSLTNDGPMTIFVDNG